MFCELFGVLLFCASAVGQHIRPPWEQIGTRILEHTTRCELSILRNNMADYSEGQIAYLSCKVDCPILPRELHWMDNNGSRVEEVAGFSGTNGPRQWLNGWLRYDIGIVGPQHQGTYKCKGKFEGIWIERSTYITIIPRNPPSTTTTSTTTTTMMATATTTATTRATESTTPDSTTVTAITPSPTTISSTEVPTTSNSSGVTATTLSPTTSRSTTLGLSVNTAAKEESKSTSVPSNVVTPGQLEAGSNVNGGLIGAAASDEMSQLASDDPNADAPENNAIDEYIQAPTTTDTIAPETTSSSISPTHFSTSVQTNSSANLTMAALLTTKEREEVSTLSTIDTRNATTASESSDSAISSEPVRGVESDIPEDALADLENPLDISSVEETLPNVNVSIDNVPVGLPDRGGLPHDVVLLTDIQAQSTNRVESEYSLIDKIVGLPIMVKRKKRESNNTKSTVVSNSGDFAVNGSATDIDSKCSGFGPMAIATVAILSAVSFILIYAFFLLLCIPKCRKKGAIMEKSEKVMEEGSVEGIEIKENPEGVSDPNGRISHGEETLAALAIAADAENTEPKVALETEGQNVEVVVEQPEKEKVESSAETAEEDVSETAQHRVSDEVEPGKTPVGNPEVAREDDPEQMSQTESVELVETSPAFEDSIPEPEKESETEFVSQPPEVQTEVVTPQPRPVFQDSEPQEMVIKESLVNGANVQLEDKAVDTIELESRDIEDPASGPDAPSDEKLDHRYSPPLFDTEVPPHDHRLSNGFQEPGPVEQKLVPERDDMTKSIEDLPPPPPIPAHMPPPPPPPHQNRSHEADLIELEAPDVVSSNVTMV